MRDFKFWDDKYQAAWQESVRLKLEISSLISFNSPPKKRYSGILRVDRFGRKTNQRQFRYRNEMIFYKKYAGWLRRVTLAAKLRKRKRMLDTTKLPYYRERILALGKEPTWSF